MLFAELTNETVVWTAIITTIGGWGLAFLTIGLPLWFAQKKAREEREAASLADALRRKEEKEDRERAALEAKQLLAAMAKKTDDVQANVALIEKATNSMKDALVKATGDAKFLEGRADAKAETEAKAGAASIAVAEAAKQNATLAPAPMPSMTGAHGQASVPVTVVGQTVAVPVKEVGEKKKPDGAT